MYEWNEAVQQMIEWIEEHLMEGVTLQGMSKAIGYSPYYCSSQFHKIAGVTIKSYVAKRRLCRAAVAVRDTDERILDIAIKYGFSSQQALTRAFQETYGCTPTGYRKHKCPIPLAMKKELFFPEYYLNQGGDKMEQTVLTEARVRVVYLPEHKFLGIWDLAATGYFQLWDYHNCDEICGTVESMSHVEHPLIPCHTGGWLLFGILSSYI